MKPQKKLNVAGAAVHLVDSDVRLDLLSPGRATLLVQASAPLSGIVTLDFGYGDTLQRYFTGYVETDSRVDQDRRQIFCRELTATLDRPVALSLRHVSARQVLAALTTSTGLHFVTPQQRYMTARTAQFCALGGGYHAMDSIGRAYGIADYLWQLQGDGAVYVGSWQHSYWADRPATIPARWLTHHGHSEARLPAVPTLRPGALVNGAIVTRVQLTGTEMILAWSTDPWSRRSKN